MRAYSLIILVLLVPSVCIADAELDVRVQNIEGAKFVCFRDKDAQKLLQLRLNYPKLEQKIELLEEQVDLKQQQIEKYVQGAELLDSKVTLLTERNVELQKKLNDLDSWWRNPYLWFGVGCVIGTTAIISIMYLTR